VTEFSNSRSYRSIWARPVYGRAPPRRLVLAGSHRRGVSNEEGIAEEARKPRYRAARRGAA